MNLQILNRYSYTEKNAFNSIINMKDYYKILKMYACFTGVPLFTELEPNIKGFSRI